MRIVLIHGYFLKGTGSNLFVSNVCKELCKMGHEVILFSQENEPDEIDFIEKHFDFDNANKSYFLTHSKNTPYPGKCILYRPNLNSFLPVYVQDQYDGYTVKEFTECSKKEIEFYINCNVNAINTALNGINADLVWSNHTIMQPTYVTRSILGSSKYKHIMTAHGSALNFSVKKSGLLKDYALEAINKVHKITFVSEFSKTEFLDFFENNKQINDKSIVISAGVDLENFVPLTHSNTKEELIHELLLDLDENIKNQSNQIRKIKNSWSTDDDIVAKLNNVDFNKENIVLFYGKYLWTKGIQLIIAAAPIILQNRPNTRFIFVGYGSARPYLEELIECLNNDDREKFIELLENPTKFYTKINKETSRFFKGLLNRLQNSEFADNYFKSAKNTLKSKTILTGFLSHKHLKTLIACSDVTVAPSIFPEAFGLVGVEALSSGIIPVQTNHSGFAEVIKKYFQEFSDIVSKKNLNPLHLDKDIVINMAYNINALLEYYNELSESEKQNIRKRARDVSVKNYSWMNMVEKYLQL